MRRRWSLSATSSGARPAIAGGTRVRSRCVPGNLRIGIIAVRTVCPFKTRVNKIFRVAKHGFITQVKEYFLIHPARSV